MLLSTSITENRFPTQNAPYIIKEEAVQKYMLQAIQMLDYVTENHFLQLGFRFWQKLI
jgi:hypothetical protein